MARRGREHEEGDGVRDQRIAARILSVSGPAMGDGGVQPRGHADTRPRGHAATQTCEQRGPEELCGEGEGGRQRVLSVCTNGSFRVKATACRKEGEFI